MVLAVLRSLVELGELDKAVFLLKQMPQVGCCPNFLSYSAVICGLVRATGRMQDVWMLVSDMLQDGNGLDATLYNCLIWGFYKDGNMEMATNFFLKMIDERYVISLECFEVFVKKLVAEGKLFDIEKLFEQMRKCCPMKEIHSYQKVLDELLR